MRTPRNRHLAPPWFTVISLGREEMNKFFEVFDSGDGVVYADDFVAAMALLATSADVNAGIEEQLQACFVMFDTRGDGRLG